MYVRAGRPAFARPCFGEPDMQDIAGEELNYTNI